jgi:hypothetical protein
VVWVGGSVWAAWAGGQQLAGGAVRNRQQVWRLPLFAPATDLPSPAGATRSRKRNERLLFLFPPRSRGIGHEAS